MGLFDRKNKKTDSVKSESVEQKQKRQSKEAEKVRKEEFQAYIGEHNSLANDYIAGNNRFNKLLSVGCWWFTFWCGFNQLAFNPSNCRKSTLYDFG